jgi:hypothetical protein
VDRGVARPVLRGLSLLFWVATGLVIIASWQLFVLSARTDQFFAWTIAQPLTAATSGAFYLSAVVLLLTSARARVWAQVRHVAWGVLTVSTGKLAATLLHLPLFHLDHGGLAARIAAWGWLVVYALIPVALAILILIEIRRPGADPPRRASIPPAFRWFAGPIACVLVAIGVALFVAPQATSDRWPWGLTPLTARDLAAWFAGIGVVGALAALDGDLDRTRPVWIASVALALLQGVALARYPEPVDWGSPSAWLYVALFASVGIAGAWGWRASLGAAGIDRTAGLVTTGKEA